MVREPIGRNISAFFEALEFYLEGKELNNVSDIELFNLYHEKLPHNYPLDWFDNEVKRYLGIDVYKYPFDKSKKYIHIHNDLTQLIITRTDATNSEKLEALSHVIKPLPTSIPTLNAGHNKYYQKEYNQFISNTFSLDYLNQMLDNQYAIHFYTTDELNTLREKWK